MILQENHHIMVIYHSEIILWKWHERERATNTFLPSFLYLITWDYYQWKRLNTMYYKKKKKFNMHAHGFTCETILQRCIISPSKADSDYGSNREWLTMKKGTSLKQCTILNVSLSFDANSISTGQWQRSCGLLLEQDTNPRPGIKQWSWIIVVQSLCQSPLNAIHLQVISQGTNIAPFT